MNLFIKICASIYQYNIRNGNVDPDINVLFFSSIFWTFQISIVYNYVMYFILVIQIDTPIRFIFFISLVINLFIIFKNKTHKSIGTPSKRFGYMFILYYFISLLLFIHSASFHRNTRLKNNYDLPTDVPPEIIKME